MSTVSDISMHIQENEEYIRSRCENCDDIIIRPMLLGDEKKVRCLVAVSYTHLLKFFIHTTVVSH